MNQTGNVRPSFSSTIGAFEGTHRQCGLLVVDDDKAVRDMLRIALRKQGFNVWLASDGHEAIELYKAHRDLIDVVLLDVHTGGLDGPHTLLALRALNSNVPCCFMSGGLGYYTKNDLAKLGASAFLAKPFHVRDAVTLIRELADMNSPTAS